MSAGSESGAAPPANFEPSRPSSAPGRHEAMRALAASAARLAGLDALTTALGRQSISVATAIVVTFAVTSASFVSYAVWWLATKVMPANVIPISAVIAFLVATPIAAYLVSIIHSLARSRAELAELSQQLITARDDAREANEAKSRFLASMSHELRTPLNAIIGFSEIMKNELFGPCGEPRYVDYARDIHASGAHLLDLINDVLDLSKIEAGREHINTHSRCELTKIIAEATRVAGVMAEKAGVDLRVACARTPIHIDANDRMMRQIVLNLLSNAIKFTAPGGEVTVSARLDVPDGVIVDVADTGVGMTDEELRVAMQPFGQIDSKVSRQHNGTGLGLPLTKAMVELHGGTLTIHSVPRKGTTVAVRIPKERLVEAGVALGVAV